MTVLRAVSSLFVAVPALGFGSLSLLEGMTEPAGVPIDRAFHLLLGVGLITLFVDAEVSIMRSRDASRVVVIGAVGSMAALFGALLSELLGPPVLLVLLLASATWAVRLWRGRGGATGISKKHVSQTAPR